MPDPEPVNAMYIKLKGDGKKSGMSVQSQSRHNATPSSSARSYLPQAVTKALARLHPRTEQVLTRLRSGAIANTIAKTSRRSKGHGRRHTRRMRKNRRRGRRGTRRR